MAEFSKQYCEKYDSGFPWDFDIDEIIDDMPNGSYRAIICEGYGFTGLEKDEDGKPYCLFGSDWQGRVPLSEIDDKTYRKFK